MNKLRANFDRYVESSRVGEYASPKSTASLDHGHVVAQRGELLRRREPRDAATNNDDTLRDGAALKQNEESSDNENSHPPHRD
jgi:hypothetical protein